MRSQPRPEQGPVAFHRVDVDFAKPIAVVVASIILLSVIDREVLVAPFLQSRIDVVLIGIDPCPNTVRHAFCAWRMIDYSWRMDTSPAAEVVASPTVSDAVPAAPAGLSETDIVGIKYFDQLLRRLREDGCDRASN